MLRLVIPGVLLLASPAGAQSGVIGTFCGGGYTGGGGGVLVDAEGGLHRLRQPSFAAPRETTPLPGPPAPLARWQALLDSAHFEAIRRGRPGNMTCRFWRGTGGSRHEVLWFGEQQFAELPAGFRTVVQELRALAQERRPR